MVLPALTASVVISVSVPVVLKVNIATKVKIIESREFSEYIFYVLYKNKNKMFHHKNKNNNNKQQQQREDAVLTSSGVIFHVLRGVWKFDETQCQFLIKLLNRNDN